MNDSRRSRPILVVVVLLGVIAMLDRPMVAQEQDAAAELDRLVSDLDAWIEAGAHAPARDDACEVLRAFQARLRSIDAAAITTPAHLDDLEVLELLLETRIGYCDERTTLTPIGPFWGIHRHVAEFGHAPFPTIAECEWYVDELESIPARIAAAIARMREGIEVGHTLPRSVMQRVPDEITHLLEQRIEALQHPFSWSWETLPAPQRERLWMRFSRFVVPALQKSLQDLRAFMLDEYLPACRESIAASDLPDGEAIYRRALREHGETDLSPRQVHDLGMREIDRIRPQLIAAVRAVEAAERDAGFTSEDDDQLLERFRTHLQQERFFLTSADEVIEAYMIACKRVDPWLPMFFATLPSLPFGVRLGATSAMSEHDASILGYRIGDLEAGQPSALIITSREPRDHPTYAINVLTMHEASPGHHLQMALANQLENLAEFRRSFWSTPFGEGWALYAEHLGDPMGLYRDPYARFGYVQSEMWRACRLAIDPAIHALGWTREQAEALLRTHALLSDEAIDREITRYIAWPGQAVSYKLGELTILELRAEAQAALGPAFDLREFHDVVLGAGCVPLKTLERRVKAWVAANPAGASGAEGE